MYPQKQQYAYAGYPPPQAYPGPYYHGSQYGPYNYWSCDQMRDLVAPLGNAAAPQAPARNPSPSPPATGRAPSPLHTFDSHRRARRPRLQSRRVYRPARRHTLSRIDESHSLQHSGEFSSTRAARRSRSNMSADTSRSVPVCNQSQDVARRDSASPQYEAGSASGSPRASMSDLPLAVPRDPATGAYIPLPEYTYYRDDSCRLARYMQYNKKPKKNPKPSNLYLAFMY